MVGLIRTIGKINLVVGKVAAPLTLVITALVLYEVAMRYFLNSPTTWSNEVNQYLLCALAMFGGGFTLKNYGHTRVDIIHVRFSPKTRAWIEVLTGVFIVMFALPMIWFGGVLSIEAIETGQTSVSAAQIVLWPSMITVPLGAIFLLMQGVANTLESLWYIRTGYWLSEREE